MTRNNEGYDPAGVLTASANRTDQESDKELLSRALDWSMRLDRSGDDGQRTAAYLELADVVKRHCGNKSFGSRDLVGTWLRRLADDVKSGRIRTPLSPELERVVRHAFVSILDQDRDAVDLLISSGLADEPSVFLRAFPDETGVLHDLGKVASALRGSGVLGQEDPVVVEQLVAFDDGLRNATRRSVAFVPEHMRVMRDDLSSWADKTDAAKKLPLLIRRLVSETGVGIEEARFPAESGVASSGFDGAVRASASSRFVPEGPSVWELSVAKSSQQKAEEDYGKRTTTPWDKPLAEATYIQVICRPWTKAKQFEQDKNQDGRWKHVLAYNVDDLVIWLETAPWTTTWFAELRGEPIKGVQTAWQWWERWLESTDNRLGAQVVLAGRETQVAQLREVLLRSRITTIGGDVRLDEVRAFVAAVLADDSPSQDGIIEPVLFVDDPDSATWLLEPPGRLIAVVPDAKYVDKYSVDYEKRVIVHVPGSRSSDIVLPPVSSGRVSEALEAKGFSSSAAHELGTLARRSLPALRRLLAAQPELHRPRWADPGADSLIRRVLLLHSWHEKVPGDCDMVAEFLEHDYGKIDDRLRELKNDPDDPLVAIVDERWHIVSPVDAWQLLGPQLTGRDIDAFRILARKVLLEPEPMQGLPSEVGWRASLAGVARRYSSDLADGVVHSLALLGTGGDLVRVGPETGNTLADSVVVDLLRTAYEDDTSTVWSLLAPRLALLAEAAPTVVLDALRHSLGPGAPLTAHLFAEQQRYLYIAPQRSPLRHFLWALKRLAWAPEHFHEVVMLLARLAELAPDEGVDRSGSPKASLRGILGPWLPNTSASVEQQHNTLDRLCREHPEVGWDLLVSMIKRHPQVVDDGARYRDWGADNSALTVGDYHRTRDHVAERLFEHVGADSKRWKTLISIVAELPSGLRAQVCGRLRELTSDASAFGADRESVWQTLRELVARHRANREAKWALPVDQLDILDQALEPLAPACVRARHEWLFDNKPVMLVDVNWRDDFEAYETALAERRVRAVREVLDAQGSQGVVAFAESVPMPRDVGTTLARIAGRDVDLDADVAALIDSETAAKAEFATGYVNKRFGSCGWPWLDRLIRDLRPKTTDQAIAAMLLAARDPSVAGERADTLGEGVTRSYWQQVFYLDLARDCSNVTRWSARLVSAGRGAEAIELLGTCALRCRTGAEPAGAELADAELAAAAVDAFEAVIAQPEDLRLDPLSTHRINELLGVLTEHRDQIGVERLTRIEWFFLSLLEFDARCPTLVRRLGEDPDFFTEVVRTAFRGGEPDATRPSEHDRLEGERAYLLLQRLPCPGVVESGEVDPTKLRGWVDKARDNFRRAGREVIGDHHIGQALAGAPADPDGLWPCDQVRDQLEDLNSDEIDEGFQTRVFNGRGVTERSLDDGGKQERDLAERYRRAAEFFLAEWPRTAKVLRRLADLYKDMGNEIEDEAELIRRGL